jgi:hypothetical protein
MATNNRISFIVKLVLAGANIQFMFILMVQHFLIMFSIYFNSLFFELYVDSFSVDLLHRSPTVKTICQTICKWWPVNFSHSPGITAYSGWGLEKSVSALRLFPPLHFPVRLATSSEVDLSASPVYKSTSTATRC